MMRENVEERVVEMQIDNKQFESGAKQTISTLEKLERALHLKSDTKAIDDLEKSVSKFDASPMTNALDKVSMSFSALEIAGMRVISNLTDSVYNFTSRTLKELTIDQVSEGWEKYANKTSSMQTIMAATRKDIGTLYTDEADQMEKVNDQLEKLSWFTDETSYRFVELVNNIGKFTSNGRALNESVTAMMGISTWASISGASVGEAERAMYNLSQALGMGAVTQIDWKSIENANMATYEFKQMVIETAEELGTLKKVADGVWETTELAENAGKEVTIASFREELKQKWFNSDVLLEVLQKYGNFTEELRDWMIRLKDNGVEVTTTNLLRAIEAREKGDMRRFEQITAGLDEDQVKLLTQAINELSSAEYDLGRRAFQAAQEAKTFKEAIDYVKEAVSTGWMQTFEIIFGSYDKAKRFWSDLTEELYEIFVVGGENRNSLLEKAFGDRSNELDELGESTNNTIIDFDGFDKKLKELGYSTEDFEKVCSELNDELNDTNMAQIIAEYGSFEEALRKGAIGTDILRQALEKLTGKFIRKSGETANGVGQAVKKSVEESYAELEDIANRVIAGEFGSGEERKKRLEELGYDYDAVQRFVTWKALGFNTSLQALEKEYPTLYAMIERGIRLTDAQGNAIANTTQELNEAETLLEYLTTDVKNSSGETVNRAALFREGLMNIVRGISSFVNIVRNAFEEVFGSVKDRGERLGQLIERFHAFTETLSLSENQTTGLQKVFETFFRVVKIGTSILGSGFRVVFALARGFFSLIGAILEVIGGGEFNLGDTLDHIADAFSNLNNIAVIITEVFSKLANKIRQLAPQIQNIFKGEGTFLDKFKKAQNLFASSLKNTNFYKELAAEDSLFGKFINKFKLAKSVFTDVGDETKDNINTVSTSLLGIFPSLDSWYKKLQSEGKGELVKSIFEALDKLGILVRKTLRGIYNGVTGTVGSITSKIKELQPKLQAIFADPDLSGLGKFRAAIKELVDAFNPFGSIKEKINELKPELDAIWDKDNNEDGFFTRILTSFDLITGSAKDAGEEVETFSQKFEKNFPNLSSWLKEGEEFFKSFGKIFTVLFEGLFGEDGEKTIVQRTSNFVTSFFKGLVDGIKKIEFKDLLKALKFGFLTAVYYEIITSLEKLKEIPATFSEVLGSLKNMFSDIGTYFRYKAFMSMALAIGVLTAAIWALTKIPEQDLTRVVTVLVVLMFAINRLIKSFEKTKIYEGNIDIKRIQLFSKTGSTLIGFAIAIVAIAASIIAITRIKDTKALGRAVVIIAGIIVALTAVMWAISAFVNKIAGEYTHSDATGYKTIGDDILKVAVGMAIIAIAVRFLMKPIKTLTKLMQNEKVGFAGVGIAAAIIAGLIAALVGMTAALASAIGKADKDKKIGNEILKFAASMAIVAIAIRMLVAPLIALTGLVAASGLNALGGFGLLIGILTALVVPLVGFAHILKKYGTNDIGKAFLAFAASMAIIAIAIQLLVAPLMSLTALVAASGWKALGGLGMIIGIMLALVAPLIALVTLTKALKIENGGRFFLALAASMLIVAIAMTVMTPVIISMTAALAGIVALASKIKITAGVIATFIAVFLGLVAIGAAMLLIGSAAFLFGAGMTLIGTGMLLAAIAAGVFAKALDPLTEKLPVFLQKMSEMTDGKFAKSIGRLLIVFLAVAIGIGILAVAIAKLISEVGKAASSNKLSPEAFGKRVAAFGQAIISAFVTILKSIGAVIIKNLPTIGKLFIAAGTILGLYLLNIIPTWADTIVLAILVLLETVHQSLRANKQNIEHTIFGIVEYIGEIVIDAVMWLASSIIGIAGKSMELTINAILDPVIEILDKMPLDIAKSGAKALRALRVDSTKLTGGITNTLNNSGEKLTEYMRGLVPAATEYQHVAQDVTGTYLGNLDDQLKDAQEAAGNALKDITGGTEDAGKTIIGVVNKTGDTVSDSIKDNQNVYDDALRDLVGNESTEVIITGAGKTIGTTVVNSASDSVKENKGIFVDTLLGAFKNSISGIDAKDLGSTISNVFRDATGTMTGFQIEGSDQIFDSSQFEGLDIDVSKFQVGTDLSEFGWDPSTLFDGVSSSVSDTLTDATSSGIQDAEERASKEIDINEYYAKILEKNPEAPLEDFANEIRNRFNLDPFTDIEEFLNNLGFDAERFGGYEKLLAKSIIEADNKAFEEVKENRENILEELKTYNIDSDSDSMFSHYGGKISDSVDSAFSDVIAAIDRNKPEVSAAVNGLESEGENIGLNIVNGINNGLSKINPVTGLIEFFGEELITLFKVTFDINSPSRVFEELAGNIPLGIAKGIDDNSHFPIESMEQLNESLKTYQEAAIWDRWRVIQETNSKANESYEATADEYANKDELYGKWYDYLGGIDDAITDKEPEVTNATATTVNNSINELEPLGPAGYEAGAAMASGAANGINNNSSLVIEAAAALGRAATESYRASLGIRSPSRVFEFLSEFIPLGAAKGIENNQSVVIESVVGLGSSLIEAMRRSMAQVSYIASDEFDFSPTITPVVDLSQVDASARSFDSMFQGRNVETVLRGLGNIDSMRIDAGSINYNNQNENVVEEIRNLTGRIDRLGDELTNMKMVLDTGVLVGELTPGINSNLGTIALRDRRQ